MEEFAVAVDDVKLEEKFVKEVAQVSAASGWDSNKYDREACDYLQCSGWADQDARYFLPLLGSGVMCCS